MTSTSRLFSVVLAASCFACGPTGGSSSSSSSSSAGSVASTAATVGSSSSGSSSGHSSSSSGHSSSSSGHSSTSHSSTSSSSSSTSSSSGTSSRSASTASSSTSTSSSSSSGSTGTTLPGHESWAWLYTDYPASITAITTNVSSFTHISPTLYTVNYDYSSGVAYYSNCGGGASCTDPGTNDFDGLTTAQVASEINALGLATVPLIFGGASNDGIDTGVQNILNNAHGEQTSFISSMVQEAVSNGYAGYNLDWEVGSGVGSSYAASFVSFVNAFKTTLAAHSMSLSVDAIASNVNGTWCSGNDGYLDFGLLSTSSVDRIIIEDYTASYGTASTSCQAVTLSSSNPVDCPLNSDGSDVTFTGLLNLMCSNLPSGMVVIGVQTDSTNTNDIAGQAISTMQSYGMDKIALWPQQEGSYTYLSSQGIVATQSDWYALLASFLGN